eukprot:scaffold333264_cov25-Prasinocladus_malaysianus.AAC.1
MTQIDKLADLAYMEDVQTIAAAANLYGQVRVVSNGVCRVSPASVAPYGLSSSSFSGASFT